MSEVSVYKYQLNFKKPFRIAGKSISRRSGLVLNLRVENASIWAEASPLLGFSAEKVDDLIALLKKDNAWLMRLESETEPELDAHYPPSLAFALSVLWYKRKAARENTTLHKLIDPASESRVDVNAALGLGSVDEVLRGAQKVIQDGYQTIKMKVGEDFEHELGLIQTLRQAYPGVKIRIDANQSWQPDTALENLKKLEELNIEYCEQPIAVDQKDKLAWLKEKTTVPIAADESIRNFEDAIELIEKNCVDVLVLKPTLIGSISAFMKILQATEDSPLDVVVTTTLETGLGRRTVAELASIVKNRKFAHGLGTGYLFEQDLINDSDLIVNGRYEVYRVADDPTPDMDLLEHVLSV